MNLSIFFWVSGLVPRGRVEGPFTMTATLVTLETTSVSGLTLRPAVRGLWAPGAQRDPFLFGWVRPCGGEASVSLGVGVSA